MIRNIKVYGHKWRGLLKKIVGEEEHICMETGNRGGSDA